MHSTRRASRVILSVATLVAGALIASAPPAAAAAPAVKAHYVYNCLNPTIEVDLYGLSGKKDVYAEADSGPVRAARAFAFVAGKVYDGYLHYGGVYQVDIYVTAAGAGPDGDRLAETSVAATSLCPVYYPVYKSNSVPPRPPKGSLRIKLTS